MPWPERSSGQKNGIAARAEISNPSASGLVYPARLLEFMLLERQSEFPGEVECPLPVLAGLFRLTVPNLECRLCPQAGHLEPFAWLNPRFEPLHEVSSECDFAAMQQAFNFQPVLESRRVQATFVAGFGAQTQGGFGMLECP